jgi:beta-glucanase (GH16 family)
MNQRLFQRLVSVGLILSLLDGCSGAVGTPTPTAIPPSATPAQTITPSLAATTATHLPSPMVTFTSSPTSSPLPTLVPPRPDLSLVFDDEFDGEMLDSTKWNPCYYWDNSGCTNGSEEEWYLSDEIIVENGLLRLRARQNPVYGSDHRQHPYTSGMISSHSKFYFTYGYFEMRAKMPKGRGLLPAFWLLPENRVTPPEIDILEVYGDNTYRLLGTLHYDNGHHPGVVTSAVDLSADFHTYAVDWAPDHIVWYLDGKKYYSVQDHVPVLPMYILANLAVGTDSPCICPNSSTQFPAYFEIDYIRVFRDLNLPTLTPTPTAPDVYRWEFNDMQETNGWVAWHDVLPVQIGDGNMYSTATGSDPYIGSPIDLGIDATRFNRIAIRMRTSAGYDAQLFFTTDQEYNFDETKSKNFSIISDGEFHIYTVDMSLIPEWRGRIVSLRFDPMDTSGNFAVDYIRICRSDFSVTNQPNGCNE